jgi:hypothetical protein
MELDLGGGSAALGDAFEGLAKIVGVLGRKRVLARTDPNSHLQRA